MENIGIRWIKDATCDDFTSKVGIKIRRGINKPLRKVLTFAMKNKIIIDIYPTLEKDKVYIFASTHSFDEDIIAALATINRSAYVLIGTTDQIDHNPQMYAAWLNGMIYVNRLDPESRKDSVLKMETILKSGSSILMFPEGGWNNTENLLCQPLFSGPYTLAQHTGVSVVPIASFNQPNSDVIYMSFGNPISMKDMTKKEALITLRDSLATMVYNSMEKHTIPVCRSSLTGDIRMQYMEERRKEYMKVKWTRDVWDEELTYYKDKELPTWKDVTAYAEGVHIDKDNADILAPVLVKRLGEKKYDFKEYMKRNWNN